MGLRCGVPGLGFRIGVSGFWLLVSGLGIGVQGL